MKLYNIAFTGHRVMTDNVSNNLMRLVNLYPWATYHSGGATGFDTEAFYETAFNRGVTHILHIPFTYQKDSLIRETGVVLESYATHCPICPSGLTRPSSPADNRFYQKRNEHMVDSADEVICYWNGVEKGGTWNAIKYARKVGKPVRDIREL